MNTVVNICSLPYGELRFSKREVAWLEWQTQCSIPAASSCQRCFTLINMISAKTDELMTGRRDSITVQPVQSSILRRAQIHDGHHAMAVFAQLTAWDSGEGRGASGPSGHNDRACQRDPLLFVHICQNSITWIKWGNKWYRAATRLQGRQSLCNLPAGPHSTTGNYLPLSHWRC